MMTWIITNHYKSPQVYHNMNHHKSQITTNHHKPWHKPPWTMTETSTKHDMNHYKSPQTITWTIMMTQKELCIKPYGFLVQTWIQVLKWSVPDAHPDSRVLSILKFSGIFENCMRGIFYSLKDTLLFKCSEFLILWSFWSGLHQMHIQMIESGIFRNRDQTVYA